MEAGKKKDIVIFFWESYISVAPTIINLADAFSDKGHNVFIFIRHISEDYAPETKLSKNVTVIAISRSKFADNFLKLTSKISHLRILINSKYFDRIILYDITRQSKKLLTNKAGRQYDCIGVDSIGLLWAAKLLKRTSSLYYLSLELLCKAVIPGNNYFLKWIKKKEIQLHKKKVKLTMIQDKYRLGVLERENHVRLDKTNYSILTNSPRKNISNDVEKDALYFDKKFNLQPGLKKILMAGMIDEATMASSVARSFGAFKKKDTTLILHERQQRDPDDPYFKQLRKTGGGNFYLSLNPLPYSDIHKIYDSADIGLVCYDPAWGDNFAYIIGASGKLSHYLMYGLPVISNDLPGFKELFEKYNIGFVLNDMNELETAVNKICLDYKFYSDNAHMCYNAEYNFNSQFDNFYGQSYS